MALCFNCGHIKFGAFIQCDECGYDPNSEVMRDASIRFSDWFLSDEDFKFYSSVIKQIHSSCNDEELCLWTFFRYISLNSPSILTVKLEEEFEAQADKLLQTTFNK